jgi:hypothetical protein
VSPARQDLLVQPALMDLKVLPAWPVPPGLKD